MSEAPFATIYVLCYGDHVDLHKRVLGSLHRHLPPDEARVVVWGNQLCKRSRDYLDDLAQTFDDLDWYDYTPENVPKYKVMRRLWHDRQDTAPTTPWILWLDDDTYITAPDWWEKTKAFLAEKQCENICYAGFKWYVHYLPGQWEFIQQAKWFQDAEPELCPTRNPKVRKPGITFANGAYVWLRADVMRLIDWPDPRLVHNGGDTLLGEAIRQNGLPFHELKYGVKSNDAKRRGRSDKPAGSKPNVRR